MQLFFPEKTSRKTTIVCASSHFFDDLICLFPPFQPQWYAYDAMLYATPTYLCANNNATAYSDIQVISIILHSCVK